MAQLASDNFDRADSSTLGANWTDRIAGLGITTNECSGTATDDLAYYNGVIWPDDQYSECLVTAESSSFLGPATRVTSGTNACYVCITTNVGVSGTIAIREFNSFALVCSRASFTLNATDVFRIESEGTTHRVKVNGADPTGGPLNGTNATVASGNAGLISGSSGASDRMNNWAGGDFSAGGGATLRPSTRALLGVGR